MNNIFEQFKNKAQQIEQTPSAQVWERLSARLDQHKKTNKIIWRRRLAVAASFLGLLGFASLWSVYFITPKVQFAALEELPTTNDLPYNISAINREYVLGRTNVEEGNPSRRLVAAFNYFYNEPNTNINTPKLADTLKKVWSDTLANAQRQFDWLLGTWRATYSMACLWSNGKKAKTTP